MHLIHADRIEARPLAVIQAVAERERPLVKSSPDGQNNLAVEFLCDSVDALVELFVEVEKELRVGNPEAGLYAA
jgi:hypothetical protein